jgi:hypothetical protein
VSHPLFDPPDRTLTRAVDTASVKTLEAFVIDSDGWGHADMVEACRLLLRTVEVGAKWCQTDIPADCEDWPPDVVAAAEVLRQIASRNGRVEGLYDYAQTGVIEVARDEVWSAFVTFAPWAYDATVWNGARVIVSLADEGQSTFVRLTPEQYGAIAAELGQASLIRYREWRRVRKERRKRRS